MKCGLILLAAGSSTRMGEPKQLLNYRGKALVRHAVDTALASACSPVIVVLGATAGAVGQAIRDLPVATVENPRWAEGMGTSIQTGVRAAAVRELDGVILALADQPLVTAEIYNRLMAQHESTGKPIVTSEYAGTVGVPVLFAKEYFQHLLALRPEQGCKGVILAHEASALRIACPEAEADIDTPVDYQRLAALH
jgi:molybdenum cofactor cytidylyltransferase